MPKSIKAMPIAMSLIFGSLHTQPWNRPNPAPQMAAASTPSQAVLLS